MTTDTTDQAVEEFRAILAGRWYTHVYKVLRDDDPVVDGHHQVKAIGPDRTIATVATAGRGRLSMLAAEQVANEHNELARLRGYEAAISAAVSAYRATNPDAFESLAGVVFGAQQALDAETLAARGGDRADAE